MNYRLIVNLPQEMGPLLSLIKPRDEKSSP